MTVTLDRFVGDGDPARACALLEATLSRLLGKPFAYKGSGTAEALLLATHPVEHGGIMLRTPRELPPAARKGNTEEPYHWVRRQTKEERGLDFVHSFDCNGQYLAAWSSISVGIGGLTQTLPNAGESSVAFNPKYPGYWRLKSHLPYSTLLPPVLPSGEWHHTETLKLAQDCGLDFDIAEAHVWTKHARYLTRAYEILRDARTELMAMSDHRLRLSPDGPNEPRMALAALKAIYSVGYGRFASQWKMNHPDRFLRPEWRHATIARARANLWRRIAKISRTYEVYPFAVNLDEIVYASDMPNAARFAAALELPIGTGLGHFKWAGTARNDAAFHGAKTSASVVEAMAKVDA